MKAIIALPRLTVPGAIKEAAPLIGISPRLVHAVDWLFRFTQPQDWQGNARPIVWPSARMQQESLGLSPTQAKWINRRLVETRPDQHVGLGLGPGDSRNYRGGSPPPRPLRNPPRQSHRGVPHR
jgi:hypothetical protein